MFSFEVYVKENSGDISKVTFFETMKQERNIYSYEIKQFYSSNDEIGYIHTKFHDSFLDSEKNSTFIMKNNGTIIETPQDSTLEILDYYILDN